MTTYGYIAPATATSSPVQTVSVGRSGVYDIVAYGAQGGDTENAKGGLGAEIGGKFTLTSGETLHIYVGGQPAQGSFFSGGGGGSFVLADADASGNRTPGTYNLLLAAGGGGGGPNGNPGQITVGDGSGGSGNGGGGGGAGYFSPGGNDPVNGAVGGSNQNGPGGAYLGGLQNLGFPEGGFGGGGSGGAASTLSAGSGGGGGYTGGDGSGLGRGGGGGQSIDRGVPIPAATAAGVRAGNGVVTIERVRGTGPVECFAAGTHVATPFGERRVENLAVGELVLTIDGTAVPIVWIGRRSLKPDAHPRPHEVRPVRIAAGAFGENLPSRDLRVSPGHGLFVRDAAGEYLIPAVYLVDGHAIVQESVPDVDYVHVELDRHDILVAEGLGAESYLDVGNRNEFETAGAPLRLHPAFAPLAHEAARAPFVIAGPVLERVRDTLTARRIGVCRQRADAA